MLKFLELIEKIFKTHDKNYLNDIEFNIIVVIVAKYEKINIKFDYITNKLIINEFAK